MREFLFKAKRIDNGEWVEGYYIRDQYHIGGKDIIFYRKDSDRFTVYTNIIDIETLCQRKIMEIIQLIHLMLDLQRAGISVLMRLQEEWINGMCKEM